MRYACCLSCRLPVQPGKAIRRGLCPRCYQRAQRLDLLKQYPACGQVEVPYYQKPTGTCVRCGRPVRVDSTWCRPCYRAHRNPPPPAVVSLSPILRDYPDQPAIIGAPQHPAWQACVAWESRPQRWSTLRPAERRSA